MKHPSMGVHKEDTLAFHKTFVVVVFRFRKKRSCSQYTVSFHQYS